MGLVEAKCTQCGANITVDNNKDAGICPHCNAAYIVEKAIKNYDTTNNIQNQPNTYYDESEFKKEKKQCKVLLKNYFINKSILLYSPTYILFLS